MCLPSNCLQSEGETDRTWEGELVPAVRSLSWTEGTTDAGCSIPASRDCHLSSHLAATHQLAERHRKVGCSEFQAGDGTARSGVIVELLHYDTWLHASHTVQAKITAYFIFLHVYIEPSKFLQIESKSLRYNYLWDKSQSHNVVYTPDRGRFMRMPATLNPFWNI